MDTQFRYAEHLVKTYRTCQHLSLLVTRTCRTSQRLNLPVKRRCKQQERFCQATSPSRPFHLLQVRSKRVVLIVYWSNLARRRVKFLHLQRIRDYNRLRHYAEYHAHVGSDEDSLEHPLAASLLVRHIYLEQESHVDTHEDHRVAHTTRPRVPPRGVRGEGLRKHRKHERQHQRYRDLGGRVWIDEHDQAGERNTADTLYHLVVERRRLVVFPQLRGRGYPSRVFPANTVQLQHIAISEQKSDVERGDTRRVKHGHYAGVSLEPLVPGGIALDAIVCAQVDPVVVELFARESLKDDGADAGVDKKREQEDHRHVLVPDHLQDLWASAIDASSSAISSTQEKQGDEGADRRE